MDYVVFVPLTAKVFYTIVAVPLTWDVSQDPYSKNKFREWIDSMQAKDKSRTELFLNRFKEEAQNCMKVGSIKTLIFANIPGSILKFAASQCYHATLSPKDCLNPTVLKRDLLILHPLQS